MDGQKRQKKQKPSGKERRAALREEKKKYAASKALVNQAKSKLDPLEELSIPLKMNCGEVEALITCCHWDMLDKECAEHVFKLEESNVREMYEQCEWGWNEKEKKEEMSDDDARYLIASTADGKLLGFSHFRFDMDFDDEVLYCYELQIEECARRRGLGGFMLGILEELTAHYNMKKTMLTVFKHNKPAQNFFKKQGYSVDETSLEDTYEKTYHYEILSKFNKGYLPVVE